MEDITNVKYSQISDLMKKFSTKAYSAKVHEREDEALLDICIRLWELDYNCDIIDNSNGSLCSTYPSKIAVPLTEHVVGEGVQKSPFTKAILKAFTVTPEGESDATESSKCEGNGLDTPFLPVPTYSGAVKTSTKKDELSVSKKDENVSAADGADAATEGNWLSKCRFAFREYLMVANFARCRYRFPIPSILCKRKYVSRSATLSGSIELFGKQMIYTHPENPLDHEMDSVLKNSSDVDRARYQDIRLLELIGISSIMDLMVENKKTKLIFPISSSEKADSENRYSNFNIYSIPYPGCEFFKEFTNQNFCSANLYYNWEPGFNNTPLSLPEKTISSRITSEWENYKNWDLRTMTENYLKLILRYILDEDSMETGFLVHCISGWDRTPLFISLIRLSLWADGLVHCSLNAKQMLFFTLAYDWYFFGHQLPDRLKYNENILYFCFEFLEVIKNETFMDFLEKRERHPSNGSSVSGAYDSAADGIETPLSSFGSATSLASSSSSNPPSTVPSATSLSQNIKASPMKPPPSEASHWPFNKENGFTFDGISDNESSVNLVPSSEGGMGLGGVTFYGKRSSPVRSPLKERNKGSPKTSPSPSAKKSVAGRKGTLNGVIREYAGKRSRKSSTTESPNSKVSGNEKPESQGQENLGSDIECSSNHPSKTASNPVPVPGVRSRHSSSSSSMGSWQLLSTSETFDGFSFDSHKSSRTSLAADMADSTQTIKEEVSPSSSLDSSHSIIIFDRRRRLAQVKDMFIKIYKKEVPLCSTEGFIGFVSNIYQKLGT